AVGEPPVRAPLALRLFGERAYPLIIVHFLAPPTTNPSEAFAQRTSMQQGAPVMESLLTSDQKAEVQRIRQLFPEADVSVRYRPRNALNELSDSFPRLGE